MEIALKLGDFLGLAAIAIALATLVANIRISRRKAARAEIESLRAQLRDKDREIGLLAAQKDELRRENVELMRQLTKANGGQPGGK